MENKIRCQVSGVSKTAAYVGVHFDLRLNFQEILKESL